MKKPKFLQRLLHFNKFNRDQWVASKAKELPEGSKILDAGAGSCRYRDLFKHCHYFTQDFCEADMEYGKIDYVCDITEIPVEEHSFDAILCTEVLEHLPEPIKAIQEFARIVKPRGKLFLTAPLGSGIHQMPYHFYGGFSRYWYEHFLPEYGFTDITITPNGGFFKHYGQESQRVMTFLFPKSASRLCKLLMFPLKVAFMPYFKIFAPIVYSWLDRIDKDKRFTVGYFVEAKKAHDE